MARELFTPFIATHVSILTSDVSSAPHGTPSATYGTLSYHGHMENHVPIRGFGAQFKPRYIFRAERLD